MGIKTIPHRPYSSDLAPCDFGYSLSSEAVVMRQLRWKRLWQRLTRSHKRTCMGPCRNCWNDTSALQPEEITSKGTSFMCVLSIKVPIWKKSGNLFNDPCIYWSVFTNSPGVGGSIPGWVVPKTQKIILDASLLNTQHCKVRIKSKWNNLGKSVAPSTIPWCNSYC